MTQTWKILKSIKELFQIEVTQTAPVPSAFQIEDIAKTDRFTNNMFYLKCGGCRRSMFDEKHWPLHNPGVYSCSTCGAMHCNAPPWFWDVLRGINLIACHKLSKFKKVSWKHNVFWNILAQMCATCVNFPQKLSNVITVYHQNSKTHGFSDIVHRLFK